MVLDWERLASRFSEVHPQTVPEGIDYVIVNGQIAVDHQAHTHVRSGRPMLRPGIKEEISEGE